MGCSKIVGGIRFSHFYDPVNLFFCVYFQVFSRNVENRNYCLSHLFTHQTFENRVVLGLAYIASARPYSPGGICSIGEHLV